MLDCSMIERVMTTIFRSPVTTKQGICYRKLVRLLLCLIALQPAIACSQVPQVAIRRSTVTLQQLVFAPHQKVVLAVLPATHNICRDAAMDPEFGVPSIRMWTGDIFYTAKPIDDNCPFAVYAQSRYRPKLGDIRTDDCIARIRAEGTSVTSIHMFVTGEDKRHYFQCEYRLSMAFIGYQGALHMAERDLFVASEHPERLYGYPIARAYSRIMPAPFVHLQWGCRIRPIIVYKPEPGATREQVEAQFRASPCRKE